MRVSAAAMAGEKVGSEGVEEGGGGGEKVDCSAAMRARAAERASGEGSGSMSMRREGGLVGALMFWCLRDGNVHGRDSWYAGGTAILSICFAFWWDDCMMMWLLV